MIYPSADKLETWGSKYSLVVLAAKRAKQLKSGAPPLIQTTSRNPLTIALEEIAAGVIHCQVADHDILPKTSQEVEVAQLLAIPTLALDEAEAEAVDNETASVFSDDVGIVSDDEDLDEEEEEVGVDAIIEEGDSVHEPVFVEDEEEEEEHFEDDADADDEPAAVIEEPDLLSPEPPKKRGRKKKVDPEIVPLDEPEVIDEDEATSEED